MKIHAPLAILFLAFSVGFGASAQAADKEQRQMMADIRILQEQSQQLQNLLNALNESLKAVNTRIDEQTASTRKAFADQKLVIDTLTADLRVVREKVDDNNVRVGSLSHELDALRESVVSATAARPAGVDAAAGALGAPPPDAGSSAAPSGAAAVGASPQKLFESARADYFAGQYDLAVLGFDAFIKTFPQAPLAADAQVLIGNAYLAAGKFDKAVEAYDAAIRNYPKANVIPEAYYKKGTALKDLQQDEKAREAFEFLINNYPDSQAATLAQQAVQGLTRPKR